MSAPKSYVDARRPPLEEAMRLEGGTLEKAIASLEAKGYFTPPPGPWQLGGKDRGHGHMNYAILDRFGDLVMEAPNQATAELVIEAVNKHRE